MAFDVLSEDASTYTVSGPNGQPIRILKSAGPGLGVTPPGAPSAAPLTPANDPSQMPPPAPVAAPSGPTPFVPDANAPANPQALFSPPTDPGAKPLINPYSASPMPSAADSNPHAHQPIPIPQAAPMLKTTEHQDTYTTGAALSPELRAKQDQAFKQEETSLREARDLGFLKAQEASAFQQKRNADLQTQAADAAVKQADIAKATDDQVSKVKGLIADFQSSKVDPQKYFKDLGPVGSALAILGAGLGAAGAALTHTENFAGRFLENQINRSIAAQEKEIETKKTNIDLANNLVAQFRQQGLDAQSSSLAAKQAIYEHYQQQLDGLAAKYSGQEIGNNYAQQSAALKQKITGLEQQQYLAAQTRAQHTVMTKEAPKEAISPDLAYKKAQDAKAAAVTLPEGYKAPDGGTEMQAKTPRLSEEMGSLLDARSQIMGDFDVIKKHMTTGHSIAGANKVILEQAFNRIKEGFHNLEGKGIRFTEQDQKMFEQIADPTAILTRDATVMNTIDEATKVLNRAMRAKGREAFGKENPFGE